MPITRRALVAVMAVSFVFAFTKTAFTEPFVNKVQASSTTTSLQPDDADVIVTAARYVLGRQTPHWVHSPGEFVAVLCEAAPQQVKNGGFLPQALVEKGETDAALADLKQRNRLAFQFKGRIQKGDVVLIGSQAAASRVAEASVAKQDFPPLKGTFQTWLPGYDKDRQRALLYVFQWSGGDHALDGWGAFVYLAREKGSWRVVSFEIKWQA